MADKLTFFEAKKELIKGKKLKRSGQGWYVFLKPPSELGLTSKLIKYYDSGKEEKCLFSWDDIIGDDWVVINDSDK